MIVRSLIDHLDRETAAATTSSFYIKHSINDIDQQHMVAQITLGGSLLLCSVSFYFYLRNYRNEYINRVRASQTMSRRKIKEWDNVVGVLLTLVTILCGDSIASDNSSVIAGSDYHRCVLFFASGMVAVGLYIFFRER